MNYDQIYAISGHALQVEKLRVDVVANNIANQHTIINSDGSHFQPMQVETIAQNFDEMISGMNSTDDLIKIIPKICRPIKSINPGILLQINKVMLIIRVLA